MSKYSLPIPNRACDYISKRGVHYYWAPEWVRVLNGAVLKIRPIKKGGDVELHMESSQGRFNYIKGSIQREFKKWHLDRQIDYILLGEDPDDMLKAERDNEIQK